MAETDVRDPMQAQAIAVAEALIPQLDANIAARLEASQATMLATVMTDLQARGLLDAEGQVVRPPADRVTAKPFNRFGDQLRAIMQSTGPGAGIDKRLLEVYAATGMSEGTPADGGFLLQDTYAADLFKRINETGKVFARITRRYPLGGNSNSIKMPAIDETSRADGSRWGGVRAYWVAEGASTTATKPALQRIALELNKLMAVAYATNEQLSDTPIIEALVRDGFGEEFGFKLDDAAINGSGVGEPLGVLNAAATVSQAKETGQAAATIVFQNVLKMWSRLIASSRGNAVWFINQDCEPQLSQMNLAVGTGGVPVYMPAGGISGLPYSTLFGRPVVPIEQCSTVGTVGDVILADMSQYWAIDKGAPGGDLTSSIHVQFLTDETAFRATYRADFRPMWTSALTPFKGTSNTVSPFVTLATRS